MSSALLHVVMAGTLMSMVSPSGEQVTFYVATDGNDTWSGTLEAPNAADDDGPFATPARARDAVRQLRKENLLPKDGVTVVVRGGTYSIDRPLEFTTEDSAAKDAPISYRAARGESVRLLGCTVRNVGGWAVTVSGGRQHGVVGCDMYQMGGGGISLSGGNRTTLTPAGHFAQNNHIHHYARVKRVCTSTPARWDGHTITLTHGSRKGAKRERCRESATRSLRTASAIRNW